MKHLTAAQVKAYEDAFRAWVYDTASRGKWRGRYFLAFLVLRYTGARLGEVLLIDPWKDVMFDRAEVRLVTLKRVSRPVRYVPVPQAVVAQVALYMAQFPEFADRVFRLDQGNVRRVFAERGEEAGLPRDLSHPHVLRHTRAFELLQAGVPVTIVQDLLGHASLLTTAVYLRASGQEIAEALRLRGLL